MEQPHREDRLRPTKKWFLMISVWVAVIQAPEVSAGDELDDFLSLISMHASGNRPGSVVVSVERCEMEVWLETYHDCDTSPGDPPHIRTDHIDLRELRFDRIDIWPSKLAIGESYVTFSFTDSVMVIMKILSDAIAAQGYSAKVRQLIAGYTASGEMNSHQEFTSCSGDKSTVPYPSAFTLPVGTAKLSDVQTALAELEQYATALCTTGAPH